MRVLTWGLEIPPYDLCWKFMTLLYRKYCSRILFFLEMVLVVFTRSFFFISCIFSSCFIYVANLFNAYFMYYYYFYIWFKHNTYFTTTYEYSKSLYGLLQYIKSYSNILLYQYAGIMKVIYRILTHHYTPCRDIIWIILYLYTLRKAYTYTTHTRSISLHRYLTLKLCVDQCCVSFVS